MQVEHVDSQIYRINLIEPTKKFSYHIYTDNKIHQFIETNNDIPTRSFSFILPEKAKQCFITSADNKLFTFVPIDTEITTTTEKKDGICIGTRKQESWNIFDISKESSKMMPKNKDLVEPIGIDDTHSLPFSILEGPEIYSPFSTIEKPSKTEKLLSSLNMAYLRDSTNTGQGTRNRDRSDEKYEPYVKPESVEKYVEKRDSGLKEDKIPDFPDFEAYEKSPCKWKNVETISDKPKENKAKDFVDYYMPQNGGFPKWLEDVPSDSYSLPTTALPFPPWLKKSDKGEISLNPDFDNYMNYISTMSKTPEQPKALDEDATPKTPEEMHEDIMKNTLTLDEIIKKSRESQKTMSDVIEKYEENIDELPPKTIELSPQTMTELVKEQRRKALEKYEANIDESIKEYEALKPRVKSRYEVAGYDGNIESIINYANPPSKGDIEALEKSIFGTPIKDFDSKEHGAKLKTMDELMKERGYTKPKTIGDLIKERDDDIDYSPSSTSSSSSENSDGFVILKQRPEKHCF